MLPNDLNAPTQVKRYHAILVELMQHKTKDEYEPDKTFSHDELLQIQPDDIYRWMCLKTYGTEDPGQEDNPSARSSSMAYWKKAISYFMPNFAPWNDAAGIGNPTKSRKINRLIQAVKKQETRGNGVATSADRSFRPEEFEQMIDLLGLRGYRIDGRRFQAMVKFQHHLIGRADDTCHIKKENLEASDQFKGYLTVKMRWSKNVQEERDCPMQILLGSMNAKYCVLLGLGSFLEKWIRDGEGKTSQWLFANGVTDASSPSKDQDAEALVLKDKYFKAMKEGVIENPNFRRHAMKGKLGTHSVRKFATSMCRRSGVSKDNTDYRARWKVRRMQDRYTDTQLDWPDVNAASGLCFGGVCNYKVKDIGITDDWLATNVCPGIASSWNHEIAAIFAKPILWACFDADAADLISDDVRRQVVSNFIRLDTGLLDGDNPVKKIEVIASESEGSVALDELVDDDVDEQGEGGGARGGGIGRNGIQWRTGIYAKLCSTQAKVGDIHNHQVARFAELERRIRRMESCVRILAASPSRGIVVGTTRRTTAPDGATQRHVVIERRGTGAAANEQNPPATLMACPRTLDLLWEEWVNGTGGSKPARDFTSVERGRVKFRYSCRKIVWLCIERLLSRGCTLPTAFARIRRVYGDVPVSHLIKKMRPDERRGGHHLLR